MELGDPMGLKLPMGLENPMGLGASRNIGASHEAAGSMGLWVGSWPPGLWDDAVRPAGSPCSGTVTTST